MPLKVVAEKQWKFFWVFSFFIFFVVYQKKYLRWVFAQNEPTDGPRGVHQRQIQVEVRELILLVSSASVDAGDIACYWSVFGPSFKSLCGGQFEKGFVNSCYWSVFGTFHLNGVAGKLYLERVLILNGQFFGLATLRVSLLRYSKTL
jgi:hypothetical protein